MWQAGFWREAAPALSLSPSVVTGVSAGAAIACLILGDVADRALSLFKELTGDNARNFYPGRLIGRRPAFPHEAMYRAALLGCIDPAVLARLHAGPELRVLLTRPPRWLGPRSGALLGFGLYEVEKFARQPVHPVLATRLGYRAEVATIRDCPNPEAVADLVLQSSCVPPFTPVYQRGGHTVLDGGIVDNVPVAALDARTAPERTLVLLTRRYPTLPSQRAYVQPSQPIPIRKFDYTWPQGLQDAYDLGRRDGETFVRDRLRDAGA